jgi:hypothetical protein
LLFLLIAFLVVVAYTCIAYAFIMDHGSSSSYKKKFIVSTFACNIHYIGSLYIVVVLCDKEAIV